MTVIHTLHRCLSPAHLQTFYRNRLDAGLSARTVQYIHALLHRSLKQALRWERAFLETAREDRLEALYVLALHCGLRQGELFGLRWEDVDLETGTLRVNRTLSRTKDGPTFTVPKTANSRRALQLTNGAIEVLKRHSKRQAEEMVRVNILYQDQGLVFAS